MWLARWWRSKGFGVHSPYAYRFITRVLCDDAVALYAYDAVDAACADSRQRRRARRLCRILRDLDPARVEVRASLHPSLLRALESHRPSSSSCGTLAVGADNDGRLCVDYTLEGPAQASLRFEDRRESVCLTAPGLPAMTFCLNFR